MCIDLKNPFPPLPALTSAFPSPIRVLRAVLQLELPFFPNGEGSFVLLLLPVNYSFFSDLRPSPPNHSSTSSTLPQKLDFFPLPPSVYFPRCYCQISKVLFFLDIRSPHLSRPFLRGPATIESPSFPIFLADSIPTTCFSILHTPMRGLVIFLPRGQRRLLSDPLPPLPFTKLRISSFFL